VLLFIRFCFVELRIQKILATLLWEVFAFEPPKIATKSGFFDQASNTFNKQTNKLTKVENREKVAVTIF